MDLVLFRYAILPTHCSRQISSDNCLPSQYVRSLPDSLHLTIVEDVIAHHIQGDLDNA